MGMRREITKKYARDYAQAAKKAKGVILDELVAVAGWSRANARRSLSTARKRKGPVKAVKRRPRPRAYGYDMLKLLIQIWKLAGRASGKYLATRLPLWLPKLKEHEELDKERLNEAECRPRAKEPTRASSISPKPSTSPWTGNTSSRPTELPEQVGH